LPSPLCGEPAFVSFFPGDLHRVRHGQGRGGDQPADGIAPQQDRVSPLQREHREHPGDAHAAYADQRQQRGLQRPAVAPHGAGQDLDHRVHHLGVQQVPQPDHAEAHHDGVGVEHPQQRHPRQQDAAGKYRGEDLVQQQAPPHDHPAALRIPRARVLPGEGGAGLSEGVDDIVDDHFQIERGGGGRHHIRAQPVDGGLDADVGDGKQRALQPGGQADAHDLAQQLPVDLQLVPVDADGPVAVGQDPKQDARADGVGDHRGQRHAVRGHAHHDDEKQIQPHIDQARRRQADQRRHGVALAAEDCRLKVEQQNHGQAQQIDAQIGLRHGEDLRRHRDQLQHRHGQRLAQRRGGEAARQRHQQRDIHGPVDAVLLLHPRELGDNHIGAQRHAHKKVHDQTHHRAVAAHGGHGVLAHEAAHHGHVRRVEQLLQDPRHRQRQRENQNIFDQRAGEHIHFPPEPRFSSAHPRFPSFPAAGAALFVDEKQSHHADQDSGQLGAGDGLVVEEIADADQRHRQDGAVNQLPGADVPARLVHIDRPGLQPHDGQSQHEAAPVEVPVFPQEIAAAVEGEIQSRRHGRADEIGHRQGRQRIHLRRDGLGADVIKDIRQHNQGNGPIITEHFPHSRSLDKHKTDSQTDLAVGRCSPL